MHLIKHKGKVRATRIRDQQGRHAGWSVEHKDGRVDAVASPQPIRVKARRER